METPGLDMTWTDALDILIMAFLIYQFLLMLKGTRAIPMGLGVFTLVFIYIAARALRLKTIYWLMNHVMSAFVIIFVILFQDELRRFLTTFTQWLLPRTRIPRTRLAREIEEILLAVRTLADRRTGALIVLERKVGLQPYVETGVRMDALVSYDLIVSLFHPASPLHDGAIIIRGNRIAAASCFLPLSTNPYIARPLGTRHRAAVGITEESDALVIVVSEETGKISLAQDGKIRMGLTIQQLRRILESVLTVQPKIAREGAAVAPQMEKTSTTPTSSNP